MDFLLKDEIKELMRMRNDFCVSILLPTHRAGRETEQDPIRLDNLLRRAERELGARGLRSPEAKQMLAPAFDLLKDGYFTRHQADGLSIFASRDFFNYYRAPIHFEEALAIGKRFHLKPLIPILNAGNRFYVLAISRKAVRLVQCSEFGANEIELETVPKNMQEALGYDNLESRFLFRNISMSSGNKGVQAYHGHGGGIESGKEYLRTYFQRLKDSLHDYLKDEKAPLVFAGVDYLFPIFKQVNFYHNVMSEAIEGNPDDRSVEELHMRALELVRPYLEHEVWSAIRRYEDTACNGQCSNRVEKVLKGACEGRVETLLVDTGARKWGIFDPASCSVEVHDQRGPGDDDLIDLATVETFLNGGAVFSLRPERMPDSAEVSAIFRY